MNLIIGVDMFIIPFLAEHANQAAKAESKPTATKLNLITKIGNWFIYKVKKPKPADVKLEQKHNNQNKPGDNKLQKK